MNKDEKILFLGPKDSELFEWLKNKNENVIGTFEKISPEFIDENNISLIISYGYRNIIKKDILEKLPDRVINLHISYLPWNRGADPNFWSFIENTPKGVTIHLIDEGIDTGDIIVQKEVNFEQQNETLKTTYQKLQKEIEELFKNNWESIKKGNFKRKKQKGKGSFHLGKDKEKLMYLLTKGWDTPVKVLEEYFKENNYKGLNSGF